MKIKVTLIFLLLCCITLTSYAQKSTVDVTYVGNSGFLIKIGDKKILIDALFKGFEGDYTLPQEIQDRLSKAEAPFDEVDLILVTHAHGDHVNPDMVKLHLENNPKTIFASTQQLVVHLKDSTERSIGFNPTKDKSDKKEVQGIIIESFLLPHGTDSRIINNAFLISVNGITFLHTGDADFDQFTFEEFRLLQWPEKKIDLAFIQHYYLRGDSLSTKFVREAIGGNYIIPIHYHFTTPPFDSTVIRQHYPDAIIFKEELQTWVMPGKNDESALLSGYYYDQPPPGDSAVMFAPEIFSLPDRLESNIALSPDGKDCYFGVLDIKDRNVSYHIYQSQYINNEWTEQTEATFSINNNIDNPILSVDGKKLYFNKEGEIWMIERSSEKWGAPKKLPSPINSDAYEGSLTESTKGVIYVSSKRTEGHGGMDNWQISRSADQSLQANNLGPIMNSSYFDYSPLIAPDGSYLIFGSYRERRDGLLFISFNHGNDEWTSPINMNSCGAKVNNTTAHHSNPSLSPDGKYLFFRRHEADTIMDVYWVSTKILKKLKKRAMQEDSPQKFTDLKGAYLGQELPGATPVVFAPGIISVDSTIEHGSPAFSPDGKEVFWQSNHRHQDRETEIFVMTMRQIDGRWTKPTTSPYGSMPSFSLDGNRLYFIPSNEIKEDSKGPYFVEKKGDSWSKTDCLDYISRYPELKYTYSLSFTVDSTMYYFGYADGLETMNNFGIYRSELIDGVYASPELLPPCINATAGSLNWTPFIAPDESYLLFSSNRHYAQQDIFISFRQSDGTWTEAYNLGDAVNTDRGERFPTLSPDGKYLFFTRWVAPDNEDVMWVSTEIIDKLREDHL